jgi:Rnl2 family RNA ligase
MAQENTNNPKDYFIKFQSITNANKAPSSKKYRPHVESKWRMEEKIHGSNFSCIGWDKDNVAFAKRTAVLPEENHRYFNFSHIKEELIECTKKLMELTESNHVNIYGELYGGNIQKEIKYQKDIKFRVFGALINKRWLPFDKYELLEESGFTVIPAIAYGTLNDLINKDNQFTSKFSDSDEKAEGFVIKYIDGTGSLHMVKNKAQAFVERHMKMKVAQQNQNIEIINYANIPLGTIEEYITNARLSCVLSKYGPLVEDTNLKIIAKSFIEDCVKDYLVDYPDEDKTIKRHAFSHFNTFHEFVIQYYMDQCISK